ncbi:MAG: SIMPL domain-containing protein [Gammaproteobacteria bacterium]|nr:SIMPL domain-containing protein [Gammaproteobacteria bacterium]
MAIRSGLLLFCLLAAPIAVQADEEPRTISVSGTGSVDVVPDIARLRLAVQRRDLDMSAARAATVKASRDFIALCGRLGIKESKVRTAGLTIQPEYRWDQQQKRQVFTGYFVQRQLEVELADLDKLGELIEGAIDAGVNEVSPPELDSSQRRELGRQALAAAATDARSNAQRIADTLGVKLGALRNLSAHSNSPRPPGPMLRMATMSVESDAGASYTPGEISLDAQVSASFDILAP